MACEKCGKPTENDDILCPECASAQEAPVEETPVENPDLTLADPAQTPKAGKKSLFIGIAVAVVAVVAIIAALLLGGNKGGPDTPQELLVDVESAALNGYVDSLSKAYGAALKTTDSMNAELEMHLQLGKPVLSLAETYLSSLNMKMDLAWLQDIAFNFEVTSKEDLVRLVAALGLGDKHILSLDTISDSAKGNVYMALPELNPNYLMVPAEENNGLDAEQLEEYFTQNQEAMDQLIENLPSEKNFRKMLTGYTDLALSKITKVEQTTSSVLMYDIGQEQTVLTATITEEDLFRILIALAERAKTDDNLFQFVTAFVNYSNDVASLDLNEADIRAEFKTAIDETIADITADLEDCDPNNYITVKTFLNKSNEVMGRIITIYSADEEPVEVLHYSCVEQGNQTAMVFSAGEIALSGSGTKASGASNGTYTLTVAGTSYLTFELSDVTENSGTLRIVPCEELLDSIFDSMDLPISLPSDLALVVDTDNKKDSSQFSVSIELDEQLLLGLLLKSATGKAETIKIPANAIDAMDSEAIVDWLKAIDMTTVLNNAKAAGIPENLVSLIEQYGISLLSILG